MENLEDIQRNPDEHLLKHIPRDIRKVIEKYIRGKVKVTNLGNIMLHVHYIGKVDEEGGSKVYSVGIMFYKKPK